MSTIHRIRHYGLLASAGCKTNIARAKQLMAAPMAETDPPAVHDTARSTKGVSSDPPLRAAGQRRLQGQYRARQGTDGNPNAGGRSTGSARHR